VFLRLSFARAAISLLPFSGKHALRFFNVVARDRVGNMYRAAPQSPATTCNTQRGSTAQTVRKPLTKIYIRGWIAFAQFATS
jgi:hypothetical protein